MIVTSVTNNSLTVADGSQCVVVLHVLTDDPPLGENGVGAQGVHVKAAPGPHQVISADVTCASTDGEVPVGQGEGGVLQHVLVVSNKSVGETRLLGACLFILLDF